jgi:transcriptional regulator with XRE-family HTH domain
MTLSVADLCKQHEITIDQLIEQTGLSADRVMAIAIGRWTPSSHDRKKIADVFGLAPGDIAWGHTTPIQHIYGHGPG